MFFEFSCSIFNSFSVPSLTVSILCSLPESLILLLIHIQMGNQITNLGKNYIKNKSNEALGSTGSKDCDILVSKWGLESERPELKFSSFINVLHNLGQVKLLDLS